MRTGLGACLWATAPLAALAATVVPQNVYINFNNSDFENYEAGDAAVFIAGPAYRAFNWVGNDTLVQEVSLYVSSDPQDIRVGYTQLPSVASTTTATSVYAVQPASPTVTTPTWKLGRREFNLVSSVDRRAPRMEDLYTKRDDDPPSSSSSSEDLIPHLLSAFQTEDGLGGKVTIMNLTALGGKYPDQKLYFQMNWGISGTSYSRCFAVVTNETDLGVLSSEQTFKNSTPVQPESPNSSATSSVADPASATISAESTASGNMASNGSSSTSGSSSGLSTGAIAGIAVAAGVVGILASVALIWFLIRRRRRSNSQQGVMHAGGPGNRTQDLVAEKEARANVSQQARYSDDDADNSDGAAAGVAVPHQQPQQQDDDHQQERSLTSHSDRQRASTVEGSAVAAAQPRYRHLVEEGMTEDDIRRLEEEERELDHAIEQAVRR